jgi:hypothetical protein
MAWMKPTSHSSALGGLRSSIQKTDGCPQSRKRCACSNLKKPALITHAVHITGCGPQERKAMVLLEPHSAAMGDRHQGCRTPGLQDMRSDSRSAGRLSTGGLGLRCKSKLPQVGRDESSLMIARTSARNTPRGCTLFHFEYLDPMHLAATSKRTIYYTPAVGQRRIDSPRRNCAATAQRGTIRARG